MAYVGPQAICPDTFLAGVTLKTYNTSIDYANITHACVHGGRAHTQDSSQEQLGLEEVEGMRSHQGIITEFTLSELFIP